MKNDIVTQYGSFAHGAYTTASGQASHAEGVGTVANHLAQHSLGAYNVPDSSTATDDERGEFIQIVGNGTQTSHSNARTLDWNGNQKIAGNLTIGAGTAAEVTITPQQVIALLDLQENGSNISIVKNDVTFYDYDGTILYSYSASDFANLSSFPANPSHVGLTAQGWNWSLSDAKTYVANYGNLNIGQMYVTDDGKTRIYIDIPKERSLNNIIMALDFYADENSSCIIDWGDENVETVNVLYGQIYNHTYTSTGTYIISISVISGTIGVGICRGYDGENEEWISISAKNWVKKVELGTGIKINNTGFEDCYFLTSVIIPFGMIEIGENAFTNCYSLTSVIIPSTVTTIQDYAFSTCVILSLVSLSINTINIDYGAFYQCFSLVSINLSPNIISLIGNVFYSCYSLESIIIPSNVTKLQSGNTFLGCCKLKSIVIPSKVTYIGESIFKQCKGLISVTILSNIETIDENAFAYCNALKEIRFASSTPPNNADFWYLSQECKIYVPTGSLSAYRSAFDNDSLVIEEY